MFEGAVQKLKVGLQSFFAHSLTAIHQAPKGKIKFSICIEH